MRILSLLAAQVVLVAVLSSLPAHADRSTTIVFSPHNLSASGGKGAHDIKSTVEGRICIFCHTPHHSTATMPLWSRLLSSEQYTVYQSETMKNLPQPSGSSRLCLSCHDGTIALGLLSGSNNLDPGLGSFRQMPTVLSESNPRKNPNLGTDLSDDHPISFVYPSKPGLRSTDVLEPLGVKLQNGRVECSSCHDAHNNQFGNFLLVNNDLNHDATCTLCHIPAGWDLSDTDSAHKTGGTRYDAVTNAVKQDGCINCHLPHSAPGAVYLQKGRKEEDTCLTSCHKDPPYTNIFAEFGKQYRHNIQGYNKIHTANEVLPVTLAAKHVECTDCHNPHQAGWQDAPLDSLKLPSLASKPLISGALRGVRITSDGALATTEYDICFKCHGTDYADRFTISTALLDLPMRQFLTFNVVSQFSPDNPSYHPVTIDRPVGSTGVSLRVDYQVTMKRIYCTDCHSPHGSDEPHIMRSRNEELFPAQGTDYPLCFGCHDRNYLLGSSPVADLHNSHVMGTNTSGKKVPCASCHDPHGVPRGATLDNGAHLINFDTRYTGPNTSFPAAPTPAYSASAKTCLVAGACHTVVDPQQGFGAGAARSIFRRGLKKR